jgi:ethanolamine utilization cobalamin adenosyltransferase
MSRNFFSSVVSVVLLLAAGSSAFAGEVIDGVVATVNRHPIFQSDWDEAICFEAFMQQKPLSSVTQEDRVDALRRLIDRQLLKNQMADISYLQPTDEELNENVIKLRAQIAASSDNQAWQVMLSRYALTDKMVKEHLKAELQVMNFVEVRLRPNIHVQTEEIESYYKNKLLPEVQQNGGKVVALNEVEPRIRELLTQQHMDELLDAWLHNLRQQSDIQSTVPLPDGTPSEGAASATGLD